jgi:hyperosmotically inducible protein
LDRQVEFGLVKILEEGDQSHMKVRMLPSVLIYTLTLLTLGCSQSQKSPDLKDAVEKALSQAGYTSVTVAQDRDKGVITLSGEVATEEDKQRAADVTHSVSITLVIANQIGVRPAGFTSEAKQIDTSLDTAIEKNFEATLIAGRMDKDITYAAKNGVLTLQGEVNSQKKRSKLEKLAASVPNVKQVVNELQVKGQKATSTGH